MGVGHAKFQLSIANGSGAITNTRLGGGDTTTLGQRGFNVKIKIVVF